jgi:hypothetical protein
VIVLYVIYENMKRIFFAIILFTISLSLSAQWFGNGLTAGTAYYGIINSTFPMQAWNTTNYPGGIIYVGRSTVGQNDLEVASGGVLNISQGITIKFCTISSDLRITGTGILNASGSSSSLIDFTKDLQTTWGHISFEGSTGSSTMNYCIVENGSKNGSGIEGYGGGIHANTNNLSISNCLIRNNYALWGGGVFVNQNMSPSISNCYVFNNRSGDGGGGFYFWNGSRSVVTNCIFDSNHCLEQYTPYYTGGGLASQSNTSIKVLNCTFVNNTSTQATGQSIMLYRSSGDIVSNCIVWGSSGNQFYLLGANTIQYTAVVVSAPGGTGNIVLSTNNTDATGPNFTNPAAADYTLTYVSPCRNSGTAIGAPTTDYLGRTRFVPYDMGAYEFLACLWKVAATSTDWNTASNWDGGIPVSGNDIIIPSGAANYPINTPGPDLTILAGNSMTLNPGARATLGNLVNNGTLTLQSDASRISSLICNSYSGNDANVQLYLVGGTGTYGPNWHYISSPFTSLAASAITSQTLDLTQWVESLASPNLLIGWVAYDGYVYRVDVNPPYSGPTFSSLTPGKGYDHFKRTDYLYTLQGQLNTSDVTCNLSYTVKSPDAPTQFGLNLLGNPFSSGLDWDQIANNAGYPLNVSKCIYFNRSGAIVYYVNGVGSDAGVTGIIPPMQGFFTKTYTTGNSITLPASARVNTNIQNRYKKGESVIPLVRINLASGSFNDNTVVRFDNTAKTGLDYDFDAPKLFLDATKPYIYSVSEGTKFAINGLPFPDSTIEIPLVINIPSTGDNILSASELQGLDNYSVTLTDKTSGIITDLKTISALTFTAPVGLLTDRFVLKIGTLTTGTENPKSTTGIFNIYSSFGMINIQTLSDEWNGKNGSVRILDLSGKTVRTLDNTSFSKNSLISIPETTNNGIYFVEIRSGLRKFVGKVVLR